MSYNCLTNLDDLIESFRCLTKLRIVYLNGNPFSVNKNPPKTSKRIAFCFLNRTFLFEVAGRLSNSSCRSIKSNSSSRRHSNNNRRKISFEKLFENSFESDQLFVIDDSFISNWQCSSADRQRCEKDFNDFDRSDFHFVVFFQVEWPIEIHRYYLRWNWFQHEENIVKTIENENEDIPFDKFSNYRSFQSKMFETSPMEFNSTLNFHPNEFQEKIFDLNSFRDFLFHRIQIELIHQLVRFVFIIWVDRFNEKSFRKNIGRPMISIRLAKQRKKHHKTPKWDMTSLFSTFSSNVNSLTMIFICSNRKSTTRRRKRKETTICRN